MATRTDPESSVSPTGFVPAHELSGATPRQTYLPFLPVVPRRSLSRTDLVLALAITVAALALYTVTMTRGLTSMSGDSNELVTKSAMLEVAHSPGSPLYVWLGKLFSLLPFGQVATRITWMSALAGAVTDGVLFAICARFIARSRLAALGGTAIFALSLTFWSQGVIAELYVPNVAFLGACIWCLLEWAARRGVAGSAAAGRGRRWLLTGVVLYGASLGIHLSNLMFLPAFGLFILLGWPVSSGNAGRPSEITRRGARALDLRAAGAALGLFSLSLLPYLWLALQLDRFPASEGKPTAAAGWPLFYEFTLNAYSGWRFAVPAASWPDRAYFVLDMIGRNFGWLALPFLLGGLWYLLRSRTRLFYLFAGIALTNFVFYGTYRVADIDVFFIVGYWALVPLLAGGLDAMLAGLRLPALAARSARRPTALLTGQLVAALAIVATCLWQWNSNVVVNDRTPDTALRDFYGNVFAAVPAQSWIFHRGAALGYDLLYYTRIYHARPDLHVIAGPQPGETQSPPWPPGPAYATTVKRDVFLPAFLSAATGPDNKWYSPELMGMFAWSGNVRRGWLTLFRLSPNDSPPPDWLVPSSSEGAQPRTPLNAALTPELTLLGVDLPAEAQAGRPITVTRYWRAATPTLPRVAMVFGEYRAVEVHVPLLEQLPQYLEAKGISPDALATYVIRDQFKLIVPSSADPGTYRLSVSTIDSRMLTIVLDPAPPSQLLPREVTVGYIQVGRPQDGALDPARMVAPGPEGEGR